MYSFIILVISSLNDGISFIFCCISSVNTISTVIILSLALTIACLIYLLLLISTSISSGYTFLPLEVIITFLHLPTILIKPDLSTYPRSAV